jgi:hypothetical protein
MGLQGILLVMLGLGVRCTANSFILSSKHNTRPTRIAFSTLYSTQPSSYDNVILYDGVCNFCNAWVDILLQVDTKKVFRFAALQSATGMKCLEGVGKERDDISSVMLIKESRDGSLKGYQKVRMGLTKQDRGCRTNASLPN